VELLARSAGPGWRVWRGVPGPVTGRGRIYARRLLSSPPVVFRSHDPLVVAEQITQWEAAQAARLTGRLR